MRISNARSATAIQDKEGLKKELKEGTDRERTKDASHGKEEIGQGLRRGKESDVAVLNNDRESLRKGKQGD